jgi:hypothetical protein
VKNAREVYNACAKGPTEVLMAFLAGLDGVDTDEGPLCVTYFDEAHELAFCFWDILRLLSNQHASTKMWYIFMGTDPSMTYYAPRLEDCQSPVFSVGHAANRWISVFSPTCMGTGQTTSTIHRSRLRPSSNSKAWRSCDHLYG